MYVAAPLPLLRSYRFKAAFAATTLFVKLGEWIERREKKAALESGVPHALEETAG